MLGIAVGVGIAGDEGVGQVEFAAFDGDKAPFEAGVAGFYGFYLGSGQHQTRLVVSIEGVIETGAFVAGNDGHKSTSTVAKDAENSNFLALLKLTEWIEYAIMRGQYLLTGFLTIISIHNFTKEYLMKDFWKYVLGGGVILGIIALSLLVFGTLCVTTMSIFQFLIRLGSDPGLVIRGLPFLGVMMTSVVLSFWMMLKIIASIIVACDVIEKIEVGENKKNKDEKTQNIEIEDVRTEE